MRAIIRDVLDWVVSRNPQLSKQVPLLEVASYKHTGCGLYANFKPLPQGTPATGIPSPVSGPGVKGPGIEFGACSLVWLENGMVRSVELAAYGDTFPEEPSGYQLEEGPQNQQVDRTR